MNKDDLRNCVVCGGPTSESQFPLGERGCLTLCELCQLQLVGLLGARLGDGWQFDRGAVIQELYPAGRPGGIQVEPTEYRVRRRLYDGAEETRFYQVENSESGTRLYYAGAIESQYEEVSVAESQGFDEQDENAGGDP